MMGDAHHRLLVSTLTATLLVVATLLAMGAGTAQLANNSSYYENQSSQVDNESWLSGREDPTLDNFTHYLTRVGGFYIGQEEAQDGVGAAGAMLLSLVLFGGLVGGMRGRSVGPVAGVVLAIALSSAVVAAQTAPNWIYAIGLFGVGLILSAVTVRVLR
jgi:hypothetical protein